MPSSPTPTVESEWRMQDFRGGGGAPTPKVGMLTYYFCRKLHENERTWTWRTRVPGTPLDPPMDLPLAFIRGW